jgi:hypothetical protein
MDIRQQDDCIHFTIRHGAAPRFPSFPAIADHKPEIPRCGLCKPSLDVCKGGADGYHHDLARDRIRRRYPKPAFRK